MKSFFYAAMIALTLPSFSSAIYANDEATRTSVNQAFGELWQKLRPHVEKKITEKLAEEIPKAFEDQEFLELRRVYPAEISLASAPGLTKYSRSEVIFQAPLQQDWKINQKLNIRVRFLGKKDYKIKVLNLTVKQKINFAHRSDTDIKVAAAERPQISYELKVQAQGRTGRLISFVMKQALDKALKDVIKDSLDEYMLEADKLIGYPKARLGAGAPLLKDKGQDLQLRKIIPNLEEKITKHHLPYGALMRTRMKASSKTSWSSEYLTKNGAMDQAVEHIGYMDSPIFSGIYLASQSYRYAVTKDEKAVENVRKIIGAFERLAEVNNYYPIARMAVPKNSAIGRKLIQTKQFYREKKLSDGKVWLSFQGKNGISRDQHVGFFYGLAIAYKLVGSDYADVKTRTKRLFTRVLNKLIRNNWVLPVNGFESHKDEVGLPTFWAPITFQKIAYLTVADEMTAGGYQTHLAKIRQTSEALWLPAFFDSLDVVNKYYKFNLSYLVNAMILQFSKDGFINSRVRRTHRLIEAVTENHLNPHFDLFRIAFDRNKLAKLKGNVRQTLFDYMKRGHREASPVKVNRNDVEWIEWDVPFFGKSTVPKKPLPLIMRKYAGYFIWERSPFSFYDANNEAAKSYYEIPGISVTWPYWHGRYLGVFTAKD